MLVLHHLRIGRSVFTAWLLEELGLDYQLKFYDRTPAFRAPPELKEVHPLGKSPVLVDDGLVLAESGAIAWHLTERYDPQNLLGPPPLADKAARLEWLQWLHYPEGSGVSGLLIKLLLLREAEPKPQLLQAFATGEVALHLDYVREFLGDKPFLLGQRLQAPDFGVTYMLHMAQRIGELAAYPTLATYVARNTARPAFVRAMEKTGG